MERLEALLACPRCRGPVERLTCSTCAWTFGTVDGWCLDAVTNGDGLDHEKRRRFEVYDKPLVARLYDLDVRLTSRAVWGAPLAVQVEVNRRALTAAARHGMPYLDVPVGSGLVLERALAGLDRPPPLIVVADISVPMLRRARRRLGEAVHYVRADVEALPLAAGSFGVVHSANGFHLFPDTDLAARQLRLVLAEGGHAHVSSWVRRGRRLAEAYMRVLQRAGYVNQPETPHHYTSALAAAGFEATDEAVVGSLLLWSGTTAPA